MISRKKAKKIVYSKTMFVSEEFSDKVSLWILRILLKLSGHNKLIRNEFFTEESLAYFLELEEFVKEDREFNKKEILSILKEQLRILEKKTISSKGTILAKNIAKLANILNLNECEVQIVEFFILLEQYDILAEATDLLNDMNITKSQFVLSVILDIELHHIKKALELDSKLNKSSIISVNFDHYRQEFNKIIELIDGGFSYNMLYCDIVINKMFQGSVEQCMPTSLTFNDYKYLKNDLEMVVPYLKEVFVKQKKGVNILFYGVAGTGKTELVKVIAQYLKVDLFEIVYSDENGNGINEYKRLRAYKTAQTIFNNKRTLLMFDEVEDSFQLKNAGDILDKYLGFNKAWFNRALENNVVPTIWIANTVHQIDNAMLRRFDIIVKVPIPDKEKRKELFSHYANGFLKEQHIDFLAKQEDISPALIERSAKVIDTIEPYIEDKFLGFKQLLNSTLQAQGYETIEEQKEQKYKLDKFYSTEFINTTIDLDALVDGVKKHKSARLCFYGAAGTGKSAFGRYIAQQLQKPFIIKTGSDLLSMWVGGTEENIADAFEEAKEQNAVLIFDEVDSFLASRASAQRSWEVTQVNEMLVQMENFEGIFIATTNLMDHLDKASLRRFDVKLKFDFLTQQQVWKLFNNYAKDLKLPKPPKSLQKRLQSLTYITPGDFLNVARQHLFSPIEEFEDFIQRLEDEQNLKEEMQVKVIGF